MSWPTTQVAESSVAQVWNKLCGDARTVKQNTQFLRVSATGGQLTPSNIRHSMVSLREARQFLNDHDRDAGLETYARLVSGIATFDLTAEALVLRTAYGDLIRECRALHNAAMGTIAADGTVVEPMTRIEPALCQNLIVACTALEAAVN